MPRAQGGGPAQIKHRRWIRVQRRTVLATALFGLTGCIGSQDDEDDSGQAEGNSTENESSGEENTTEEEPQDSQEDEPADGPVEDDAYKVEQEDPQRYNVDINDDKLLDHSYADSSLDLQDREHPEIITTSDGTPEMYSEGVTEDGRAIVFYDNDLIQEEPLRYHAVWTIGADHPDVDEHQREVVLDTTQVPDDYIEDVGEGLYKTEIPFGDLYEDWDDLRTNEVFSITVGQLGNSSIEEGDLRGELGTRYTVGVSNKRQ